MSDKDINYTIGGYSILEDVASGLIAIVTGTVRFMIRAVCGAFDLVVDLKDGIADLVPTKIPQRRSVRPRIGSPASSLVELAKLRAGIF